MSWPLNYKRRGTRQVCRIDADSAAFSTFVAEDVAAIGGGPHTAGALECYDHFVIKL